MEAFLKELDEDSQPVPLEPPGRVTFSFDSSGWLYTYHLGVACCLQQQLLGQGPSAEVEEAVGDFAFSGSSGGALVAAALATGVDIYKLADFVISCQEECQYNPWRMFPCTERALHRFIGSNAHEQANGRLRVLLTRIQVLSVKPALRPETVSTFASTHHLKQVWVAQPVRHSRPGYACMHALHPTPCAERRRPPQVLRASCHIPILAGGLPYHVERQQAADGTVVHAGGNFIDGLYWPSVLFMWRAFDRADTLIKVSGLGNPTAAIRPPMPMPLHWVVLPPSPDVLWKIFACGYHDAARWLTRSVRPRPPQGSTAGGAVEGRRRAAGMPLPAVVSRCGASAARGRAVFWWLGGEIRLAGQRRGSCTMGTVKLVSRLGALPSPSPRLL